MREINKLEGTKVENKKEVRILNGDMVQSITLMPEKYQNKD